MIDWGDIRYFLAVAHGGSVRAAAERLRVNHSTVLRRIAQLEQSLGAELFEKLPSGYRLTGAGSEILEPAERMEESANQVESRVLGRDQSASGPLRVTLPPTLATYLLTADLADFARLYPDVEMEILSSNELLNLTTRDADVAIRVVYDRGALPPNLHARKGPLLAGGVYVSRQLLTAWRAGSHERIRWVVKDNYGIPDWALGGDLPVDGVPFRVTETEPQVAAVREGLGVTTLSCFVGDADPVLVRVPGTGIHVHGCLWILTRGDARKTKRVRLFIDYIASRLARHEPLLAGRCVRGE